MSVFIEQLENVLVERFGVPAGEFSEHEPLSTFGVDSLVAVELTLHLRKTLGVVLEPGEISANHTPSEIEKLVDGKGANAS